MKGKRRGKEHPCVDNLLFRCNEMQMSRACRPPAPPCRHQGGGSVFADSTRPRAGPWVRADH